MRLVHGFTLAEIVIAVFLSSLMMIGLYAIFSTAYQYQMEGYQKDRIQASHLLSVKSLAQDLRDTTVLFNPPPPCPAGDCGGSVEQADDYLMGCTNYDPGVPSTNLGLGIDTYMLDTTSRMRVYRYCIAGDGKITYTYRDGSFDAPVLCPGAPVPCGVALGAGQVELTLGEDLSLDPGFANYFVRPKNANNLVELHYRVGSGTATVTVNTSMQLLKDRASSQP